MNHLFKGAPPDQPNDIVVWAEENVRLVGSVRSERYDRNITPWTIEPIVRQADTETKRTTLVKPVQTGGSRVGLIALCWWSKFGYGQIQYNWEKDEKAAAKWENETLPTLEACRALDWLEDPVKCYAKFQRTFIRSQGVWIPENLDSDSIPYQVNEEIHAWKPGHLSKARGRQTAVWRPKALDISNAGMVGDQLHLAFEEGTMQFWMVPCPGCSNPHHPANTVYHVPRTRWEDSRPDLGGLRYDSAGCDLGKGKFNYNKLEQTIRYQMPCGYCLRDHPAERRPLSLAGRYSEPTNIGAHLSNRSYTYEAVAVDFIPWLLLIQEKHAALRARKSGDNKPWEKYITERECGFYSDESLPFQGAVVLNLSAHKSREGLAGRAQRFWWADKQRGYVHKGEMTHYWLVIRDVMPNADSQLVFEGMVQTDSDLIARLDEHQCQRQAGGVDCTWDRQNVLQFCYRNNCHALTVSPQKEFFFHKREKVYRIWSEPEPLHKLLNVAPRQNYTMQRGEGNSIEYVPHTLEPRHWSIHNIGAMKLLFFLRDHRRVVEHNNDGKAKPGDFIVFDVPGDVSEEYKHHAESWEQKIDRYGKTQQMVEMFTQVRAADHMLKCESYISVLLAMSGILGQRLTQMGISDALLGGSSKNLELKKT